MMPGRPELRALTRRAALGALVGVLCQPWRAHAHSRAGPVNPPRRSPAIRMLDADGRSTDLRSILTGASTAVQLMFTGCSATCPLQGAIFADAQQRLHAAPPQLRLLSISIDPLGDDPAALRAWLARHGAAAARWHAAVPTPAALDPLLDHFGRFSRDANDGHSTNVFVFDRRADLVFVTTELPGGEQVQGVLRGVHGRG